MNWHDSDRQKRAERLAAGERYHAERDALASAFDAEIAEAAKEIRTKYAELRRGAFERYVVERDAAVAAHAARVEAGGLRP